MDAVDAPQLMDVYAEEGEEAEGLIPKVGLDAFRKTDQVPASRQEIDFRKLCL